MIENDSRKDVFSTADELALLKLLRPSKFDDLLLANSNALDKQIDESFADGNRQKVNRMSYYFIHVFQILRKIDAYMFVGHIFVFPYTRQIICGDIFCNKFVIGSKIQ